MTARSRNFYLLAAVLALFFHAALLALRPWSWVTPSSYSVPRVQLTPIDPDLLEKIRRRNAQESGKLLLNRGPRPKEEVEAPKDARYLSDRNQQVTKEQRARLRDALARPGVPDGADSTSPAQAPAAQQQPKHKLNWGRLGSLGVPLRFNERTVPKQEEAGKQPQAAPRGGAQELLENDLPEGDQNLLNTRESRFYSFYARIYDAIVPTWSSAVRELTQSTRMRAGTYITRVTVILDARGNLTEIRRDVGSGIPELDEAVRRAWMKVERFPNPPSALVEKDGRVYIPYEFHVQLSERAGLDYSPPRRLR